MRFRKKPVVIEAMQWNGNNWEELKTWSNCGLMYEYPAREKKISIKTLEGRMIASSGDWVIKGVKGEFYPVKNDIFLETYEKVE